MFPSVYQKDLLAYKMHNNEKMVLYLYRLSSQIQSPTLF